MYLHEKDYYEFVSFLQGNQHIKTVGKKINTKKKKKKTREPKVAISTTKIGHSDA